MTRFLFNFAVMRAFRPDELADFCVRDMTLTSLQDQERIHIVEKVGGCQGSAKNRQEGLNW